MSSSSSASPKAISGQHAHKRQADSDSKNSSSDYGHLTSSPYSAGQSWIVDNIRSLISSCNQDEDELNRSSGFANNSDSTLKGDEDTSASPSPSSSLSTPSSVTAMMMEKNSGPNLLKIPTVLNDSPEYERYLRLQKRAEQPIKEQVEVRVPVSKSISPSGDHQMKRRFGQMTSSMLSLDDYETERARTLAAEALISQLDDRSAAKRPFSPPEPVFQPQYMQGHQVSADYHQLQSHLLTSANVFQHFGHHHHDSAVAVSPAKVDASLASSSGFGDSMLLYGGLLENSNMAAAATSSSLLSAGGASADWSDGVRGGTSYLVDDLVDPSIKKKKLSSSTMSQATVPKLSITQSDSGLYLLETSGDLYQPNNIADLDDYVFGPSSSCSSSSSATPNYKRSADRHRDHSAGLYESSASANPSGPPPPFLLTHSNSTSAMSRILNAAASSSLSSSCYNTSNNSNNKASTSTLHPLHKNASFANFGAQFIGKNTSTPSSNKLFAAASTNHIADYHSSGMLAASNAAAPGNGAEHQFWHHQSHHANYYSLEDSSLGAFNSNKAIGSSSSSSSFLSKKSTKSASTLFKDGPQQPQHSGHFFPHSTSYENIGAMSSYAGNRASSGQLFRDKTNSVSSYSGSGGDYEYMAYNNSNKMSGSSYQQQSAANSQNMAPRSDSTSSSNSSSMTAAGATAASSKDHLILHVRNLDYKISADEWKRILLENFRKHCKDIHSVSVLTNADKSLLGVVKLGSKEDAKLAISCLHHKKIGYKRLTVSMAFGASSQNSPKSKVVALLKSSGGGSVALGSSGGNGTSDASAEMPLTRFIEMYETRYNQSITISELFKLKDIVHITHGKDGQGRNIRLTGRTNYQTNMESEIQELLHTPYCSLHSQTRSALGGGSNGSGETHSMDANTTQQNSAGIGWLPNVVVSLRTFKSAVHKLLNDHGGQMPLLSFLDCYRCCIYNENRGNSIQASSSSSSLSSLFGSNNSNSSNKSSNGLASYQLVIDSENGVPLEHLITCAQDVQIQYNEDYYKQLQWENDKSKPVNLQSRTSSSSSASLSQQQQGRRASFEAGQNWLDSDVFDLDDSIMEDSQRKLNQFSHEVVELFKCVPRCVIPLSKFNNEYHKKYGRQCRVADYGYTKLYELLESVPHILQVLDAEFEKKYTLTHRVQVRRFSNDLLKVLKAHSHTKQMFADEYPLAYERHFGKAFDIRDYGVCFLEDMLAELPEAVISRKEVEGRTFVQIPRIVQMDEERLCTNKLALDVVDMLRHKPRFSIQFNKFIPNYHHHFGRQCKLSNYGFTKLIELLEAMSDTVQVLCKDGMQFVQLRQSVMLDLICQSLVKFLEENCLKMKQTLCKLEEMYNSKHEPIYYQDFDCDTFAQLFAKLPLKQNFISVKNEEGTVLSVFAPIMGEKHAEVEWLVEVEALNERDVKRVCKLMLKKLMDESEEGMLLSVLEARGKGHAGLTFAALIELLAPVSATCAGTSSASATLSDLNNRSYHYIKRMLGDYLVYAAANPPSSPKLSPSWQDESEEPMILGLSELYTFAKQIRSLFRVSNALDMTLPELDSAYRQKVSGSAACGGAPASCLPYKRLGYTDANLLLSQGIGLLVTIKKFNDKRVCLNREFWPKSFLENTPNSSSDSFSSPVSTRTPNNSGASSSHTPLSQRYASASSSSSSSSSTSGCNVARRNIVFPSTTTSTSTTTATINNDNASTCDLFDS